MRLRLIWMWMALLVHVAPGSAQESAFSPWTMSGDTIVALPPPLAQGRSRTALVNIVEAGELLARELGFANLEAAMPLCFEATVQEIAVLDERASGRRSVYGTNGSPERIRRSWGEEIRESCRWATSEWLFIQTRESVERSAPPWESVWHAVIAPMRQTSYWARRRIDGAGFACDELLTFNRTQPNEPGDNEARARRANDPARVPAAEPCLLTEAVGSLSTRATSDAEQEKARIAFEMVAAIGLTADEAASLNAFAFSVMQPDNEYYRSMISEQVCDRMSSFETAAAYGRALDAARDLAIARQAELLEGIHAYLDDQAIAKIYRYAVERQPSVRLVDHEAWYSKFATQTAAAMARGACWFVPK